MRALEQGYTKKMRTVKVETKVVLQKIKANREKHVAEYKEAMEGYRQLIKETCQQQIDKLQELRDSVGETENWEDLVASNTRFPFVERPQSHEKDYDQVISMFEMSVDKELEIRSDEFARYVMDDWEWKDDFSKTVGFYNSKR